MKNYPFIYLVIISALFLNACVTQEKNSKSNESIPQEDMYLGQKPPGLKAEVFAPGIVTTEHREYFGSFTPDFKGVLL